MENKPKRPRCNGKVFYHPHTNYKGSGSPKRESFTTKQVEKYFIYLWGEKFKELTKEEYLMYKKAGARVEIEVV